jgi:hypothetical protein
MEEDIHTSSLESKLSINDLIKTRLQNAIDKSEKILDYESSHNIELLQALTIVKQFIIRKKRVCYGGTAMNALLPKKDKFYDPNFDLPDYDFLTPDADEDVKELVVDLRKSGFKDVFHRVGVHEGTKKILVNYVAVADITQMNKDLYKVFLDNSKIINKLHFTNENMLRMMMYLELSRPRGEVSRWIKVYERLDLLNKHFKMKECKQKHYQEEVSLETRKRVLDFIISKERTLANLDLENIYAKSLKTKSLKFNLIKGGSFIFYSPNPKKDAFDLKDFLYNKDLRILFYEGYADTLPNRIRILENNVPIAVIIEEKACNSYNNILTSDNKILHIASLQTLITLYFSFYFFTKSEKPYLCDIGKCINTFSKLLSSKISMFDPFPIDCTGYQKGFPTLLREKKERIKKEIKKNTTLKKR